MFVCLSVGIARLWMIILASLLSGEEQIVPNGHPKFYRTIANSDYTSKVQTLPKGHSYMGLYWTIDKNPLYYTVHYVHCTLYAAHYTLHTIYCK